MQSVRPDETRAAAIALPDPERDALARELLASLDEPPDASIRAEGADETGCQILPVGGVAAQGREPKDERGTGQRSNSFKEVLASALAMASDARAELVIALEASLEVDPPTKEWNAAWGAEAERRLQEMRDGKVKWIPWQEVLREVHALLDSSPRKPTTKP